MYKRIYINMKHLPTIITYIITLFFYIVLWVIYVGMSRSD